MWDLVYFALGFAAALFVEHRVLPVLRYERPACLSLRLPSAEIEALEPALESPRQTHKTQ